MVEDFEHPKDSKAYKEGFRAFKEGFTQEQNPYTLEANDNFKDWKDGWEQAYQSGSF